MSSDENPTEDARISTDEETVRQWADEHDAVPVRHTASDDRPDRLSVLPEENVGDSHERVEWDSFFEVVEERNYVIVHRAEEGSQPFEVIERDEAVTRVDVDEAEFEERLLEGQTVTSRITETTTVERTIVEETTIESELVETEVVDEQVVDVELATRECTGCDLVANADVDDRSWFDADRYLDAAGASGSVGSGGAAGEGAAGEEPGRSASSPADVAGIPYRPELEVEETWSVTRELDERFTVESRIEDVEITEMDTIEDHDIDIEGLHRTIAESGLLEGDISPEEVMTEYDVESEIAEADRIHTHFDRVRVLEDEVADRKRLEADVTGGEIVEMEVLHSMDVAMGPGEETLGAGETTGTGTSEAAETETAGTVETETGDTMETETADAAGTGTSEPGGTEPGGTEATEPGEPSTPVTLTDDEIGKTVVDATGEDVGMVTDVDEGSATMYVDARPSITDRIKAALDWGDVGEDDLPVHAEQVGRVTRDEVELKQEDRLDETR